VYVVKFLDKCTKNLVEFYVRLKCYVIYIFGEFKMRAANLRTLMLRAVFSVAITGSTLGKIIYVDDDAAGANNGTSWVDAYIYLQDALADANCTEKPVEIRVAQGIYKPDQGGGVTLGDKWVTFQLISGVTLRGGYAGLGEPDPNTRNVEVYQTILSGDLDGNDVSRDLTFETPHEVWQSYEDNSECIVDGSSTDHMTVLDGFVITGGYYVPSVAPGRSGTLPSSIGGGMRNISGSPTVINCTFKGNSGAVFNVANSNPAFLDCRFVRNLAGEGGAIVSVESNPEILECVFEGNSAWLGGAIGMRGGGALLTGCSFSANQTREAGGAISNNGGHLRLVGCQFNCSRAGGSGGAVYIEDDAVTVIEKCTFFRNETHSSGGAVGISDNAVAVLEECVFLRNRAFSGGACYAGQGDLSLFRCIFQSNFADNSGGGLYLNMRTAASVKNCTFESNRALRGGGIFGMMDNLAFEGCILTGNWATETGSSVHGGIKSMLRLMHCTLADNRANRGTSIALFNSITVRDSIIWDQSAFVVGDKINITYSNVQGIWSELGEGNITADPCFAEHGYWDPNGTPDDPNDDFWVDGDYHLKSQAGRWDPAIQTWIIDDITSPCIDAGNPKSPIGHEPFPNGGRINMGAYGGTAEASKSYFGKSPCETIIAGDINGDCKVDFADFAILTSHWLEGSINNIGFYE
jgi:hypothetical protein